jgi:hypothetical protein
MYCYSVHCCLFKKFIVASFVCITYRWFYTFGKNAKSAQTSFADAASREFETQ